MAEIAAVPWNGFTAISTFSGCGGSCLGYRMAGFRVAWASEFIPAAADVYRANHPDTILDTRDIREVKPSDILEAAGLKVGELDLMDGSPPCFRAGTLILTRRGLIAIEDVIAGDMVVTHLGRWRRVTGRTRRTAEMVSVRGHGHPGIATTTEHPFFVRFKRGPGLGTPEWRCIGDCMPNGKRGGTATAWFWGMRRSFPDDAIPDVCRDNARSAEVPLSEALFWLVGMWLGNGWLRRGKAYMKTHLSRGEVLICAGKHKQDETRRRIVEAGLPFSEAEMRTSIRFTICHKGLAEWLEEDFGCGARGKTVPYWAFGMRPTWRQALLDGYVFTDGTRPAPGQFRTCSVSWALTLGMAMISRSLGIATSVRSVERAASAQIENRVVNTPGAVYCLDGCDRPRSFVVEGDYCWGRIKQLMPLGSGEVFNLHVEEDESYLADGLIVHNCASFSTAGKREKHWGKAKRYSETVQRTDDLFFEFIRLLDGLKPKVFVAENVSGLVKGVAKGYFLEILARLKACGYRVGVKILDAQWLGVPQARQRTIFIGVREDLGKAPAFPRPLPYRYTLRDALPWIVRGKYGPTWKPADAPSPTVSAHGSYNPVTSHQGLELVEAVIHDTKGKFPSAGDITDRPSPAITVMGRNQFKVQIRGGTGAAFDQKGQAFDPDKLCPTVLGTKPNQFTVEGLDMSRFAIGKEWDRLRPGESSDRYFNLVRPHPDAPCPTICASHGHPGIASVTHPTEKRKLAIAELKRICAFPDDFVLTGTYSQQWERLGRAVPPVMAASVARTIRDEILT